MKSITWLNNALLDDVTGITETEVYSNQRVMLDLDNVRQECLKAMSQIDNLNNGKWHFYRKLLNEYDFDSRHYAVNRAFYKLWEMLKMFPPHAKNTNQPLTSLHLAEAPGSFVQVLKKMYPESHSVAISKPPSSYAEVLRKSKTVPVFDDIVLELNQCEFLYSDLLNPKNVLVHTNCFSKDEKFSNGFDLITGDGGFDEEKQYDCKETLHFNLILAEIVLILLNQKIGGQSVLKIFEVFTDTTLSMLWLLCCHYESFEFVKPSTSRPTNAERYIICKGFKGCMYNPHDLVDLMNIDILRHHKLDIDIPDDFISYVKKTSEEFAKQQINAINEVISFIKKETLKSSGNETNDVKKDGFLYVNKKEYMKQKRKSFQEWKVRFCYQENVKKSS